jgi:hypothetical protein
MDDRPKARTERLASERIGDELVVYDQISQVAHCLSPEATAVWELCDGRLTQAEIADRLTCPSSTVERAVRALDECHLLDEPGDEVTGYSRRQAAIRLAKVGGAAFAAPLIYSAAVGSVAAAASHLAAGCPVTACTGVTSCPGSSANGTNSTCASGRCYCSTLSSTGTSQNQLRCAISSSCTADNATCTSSGACCGNNCPTAAPRRCRPAAC